MPRMAARIGADIDAALAVGVGGATDAIVYDPVGATLFIQGWAPRAAASGDMLMVVTDISAQTAQARSMARPDVIRAGQADRLYSGFRIEMTGVDPATIGPESRLCILALREGEPLARIFDARTPDCRLDAWLQ
jgi:hypothetical protein